MEAHDEPTTSGDVSTGVDAAAVRRVYECLAKEGMLAGVEALLAISHEDIELRSYAARAMAGKEAEVLRGHDEIRTFFRERAEQGFAVQARTRGYDVEGDTVGVSGSIRLARPDGSFAETSVRWKYRFRDGLVDEVSWEPRAGS